MARKLIADASAAELRDFAALFLGLEIDGNENTNVMKAKLQAAGYGMDSISMPEKHAPADPAARPGSYRTITKPNGQAQEQVCVMIQKGGDNGGDKPIPVSIISDGFGTMLIPRGEPVWIPVEYEGVLRNAMELVYEESLTGIKTPYERQSYPYAIALPA